MELPHTTEGQTWGEVFFALVNLQNLDPLPRAISNRTITIGLTSGYLRLETSEGKSSFTKADWEEKKPCWVEQTIFDQNMKELLSKKKSIKLAEQKPYGMAPSTTNNVGTIPKTPRKEKQNICYWDKETASWKAKEVEFNVLISSNMPPKTESLVDDPPRSSELQAKEEGPLFDAPSSDFENQTQRSRGFRYKEEETQVDHHSPPPDYRKQGSRGSQTRGEIPPANQQFSLLDQPLRRREPKVRNEAKDYDLLKF